MDIRGSELFEQQHTTPESVTRKATVINSALQECQKELTKQEAKNVRTAKLMRSFVESVSMQPTVKSKQEPSVSLEKQLWFSYTNFAGTHILDIEFVGNSMGTYVYAKDDGLDGSSGKVIRKRFLMKELLLLNSYINAFARGKQME